MPQCKEAKEIYQGGYLKWGCEGRLHWFGTHLSRDLARGGGGREVSKWMHKCMCSKKREQQVQRVLTGGAARAYWRNIERASVGGAEWVGESREWGLTENGLGAGGTPPLKPFCVLGFLLLMTWEPLQGFR